MGRRDERSAEGVIGTRSCPSCSEPLEGISQFCSRCGGEVSEAGGAEEGRAAAGESIACDGCGAEVTFPAGEISARCPFCGSPSVKKVEFEGEPPEFVIGFAVDEEKARAAFRSWIGKGGFFCPGDLARSARAGAFRAVYLPCWSFSALAESTYRAGIGEYWWRTETYTVMVNGKPQTRTRRVRETEWYEFGGRFHAWQSAYLVSASRGLPQDEFDAIKPFQTGSMRRYSPGFLAGWAAEAPSIDRQAALTVGSSEFKRRQLQQIGGHLPGDTHKNLSASTTFSRIADDLVYVPLWICAYRYRQKAYRFLINGQTGRLHGKRPLSALKITVVAVVAFSVIAGIVVAIASA
jgi:hypothetical protein